MHKDGGPVIGIQIENEYGHAGGPSDREEGMAHMHTLRAMAEEKGLREPLILLGTTAFVVNVKNNKVVTVVNEDSLKGTVFTNIDGTVMI